MRTLTLSMAVALLAFALHAAPDYKADQKIGEGTFKAPILGLAVAGDSLYALEGNGHVQVFSAKSGELTHQFDTGMTATHALALNAGGELHVFATTTVAKEVTRGTNTRTVQVPDGVTCKVFDKMGKELRTLTLDALKSAKAAAFVGDKLVVADMQQRTLFFLDAATGTKSGEIKEGLRLCCGIFDFCVGPDKSVAVSNLGAFKLQQYDLDGKLIKEFGRRGKELSDFHGCCNPVSAGYLAGGIVTVEKSPTRVKIFEADGTNAKLIEGVEELVQGCSHIPIAINAEGSIFLAASRKGYLVKCVPKT